MSPPDDTNPTVRPLDVAALQARLRRFGAIPSELLYPPPPERHSVRAVDVEKEAQAAGWTLAEPAVRGCPFSQPAAVLGCVEVGCCHRGESGVWIVAAALARQPRHRERGLILRARVGGPRAVGQSGRG